MNVDWSVRGDYMFRRHRVTVKAATEAVLDPQAIWLEPDPKSVSGRGIRIIGFSETAAELIVVILLRLAPLETYLGLNGWPANSTHRRSYGPET